MWLHGTFAASAVTFYRESQTKERDQLLLMLQSVGRQSDDSSRAGWDTVGALICPPRLLLACLALARRLVARRLLPRSCR